MSHCPTCGRTMHLTPIEQRIFDLMKRAGELNAEALRIRIWGNRSAGTKQCLQVHMCNLNRKIAHLGVKIKSTTEGRWSVYRYLRQI